ncbi:MAG TPA: hypothetical protein VM120_11415 [Bryobacteraceae bacterium]|nr:hypothetical protein [Bryobacteraceae bacterium]
MQNRWRWSLLLLSAAGIGRMAGPAAESPAPAVDVLTNRYDVARTGANLRETVLTVKNVNSRQFGKLFEREVDGDIYAQPLIKTGVNIPRLGVRDVVYVATVNNSLYAFDATVPAAAQPYWHVGPAVFAGAVPKAHVTDLPSTQEYLNFATTVGIVATPVIDGKTNTIYVVAQSRHGEDFRFRLHAFDLATGREKTEMNSPQPIEASYLGNGIGSEDGKIRFKARKMLNRPGLLLMEGVVYLAFSTHLDGEPTFNAHGWVLAYDAATLKQVSVLCTTPDGIQGGIWQSGAGLASEKREGPVPLLYAVVGNGSVGGRNHSQSILQLFPGALLSVKLTFVPADHAYQNDRDLDLSTGPVLLPDYPLIAACSKEGKCYVVNRTTMRLVQEFQAGVNSYGGERAPNIHGTPVVWKNTQGQLRLYVWAEEDFLRAYQFDGQRFQGAGKSSVRAPEKSMPGGMLSLSANGSAADSAIVWAALPLSGDANAKSVDGVVRAFDASNVGQELWNSEQQPARDKTGLFAKFCPPVIANGKVYVATFAPRGAPNQLVVYGLLPASAASGPAGAAGPQARHAPARRS